jgi:crossover junction endodeoxyribonuclease RuvC
VIVGGVDVGLSGAIALLDTSGEETPQIWDMPTLQLSRGGKVKREVNAYVLADMLRAQRIGHLFIEQVWAMPGQGSSSGFALGQAFGVARGVAAAIGIPMTFVAPKKWKADLGVPAAKDGARARASQLLPSAADQWPLVKHDGRAEAALIALWGIRSLNLIASAA